MKRESLFMGVSCGAAISPIAGFAVGHQIAMATR
jgi:hypothetical protein